MWGNLPNRDTDRNETLTEVPTLPYSMKRLAGDLRGRVSMYSDLIRLPN